MVHDAELAAATEAVRAASAVCRQAQSHMASATTLLKGDDSPVTIADFAAQAVVCAVLSESLGAFRMVSEEDAADLAGLGRSTVRQRVLALVRSQLGEGVTEHQVLHAVGAGRSDDIDDRFWTLDPIDGTKGFLRGDQYAIALALVEEGQVVLGVLGCPNLPNPDGSRGATFVAFDGHCEIVTEGGTILAQVATPATIAESRFCESVESGHSNHDHSARVAALLGITSAPHRIDSQCKYGAVARGDASIYLRLPTRADYREMIWDHAAGSFVVQQAGGRVTDVHGAPLDFRHGRRLEANQGVIATDGRFHDQILGAVAKVLGDAESASG